MLYVLRVGIMFAYSVISGFFLFSQTKDVQRNELPLRAVPRVLSVDGGGIRGIVELLTLSHIMDILHVKEKILPDKFLTLYRKRGTCLI